MDLDKEFVASLIEEGPDAVQAARKIGVEPEMLDDKCVAALEFVYDYAKQHKSVPTFDSIYAHAKVNVDIFASLNTASYYAEKVLDRNLVRAVSRELVIVAQSVDREEGKEAYDALSAAMIRLRGVGVIRSRVQSLWGLGEEVLDHYERVKAGERGVLTPWPTINNMTLGFWPEDLILFAARTGTGKSWVAILLARQAWRDGHRVLFVTTEMARRTLSARLYATDCNLPYRDLTHGRLDMIAEQRFRAAVAGQAAAEGLDVIGDFDYTLPALEAAVAESNCDILIIDGAYLIKTSGERRNEQIATLFNELKRLARSYEIPVVVTTQFNRTVHREKLSTVSVDAVSQSDVAGWNADIAFGLGQTKDMRRDARMLIKTVKVREGSGDDVELNWDFSRMDFTEIPKKGGGDADEFGWAESEDPTFDDTADDYPF